MFQDSTLIIYESPFRVVETLKAISKVDDTRRVAVGRELTKKFEQIVMQEVGHLINAFQNDEIMQKGEFVILIEALSLLKLNNGFNHLPFQNMSNTIYQNKILNLKRRLS